MATNFFQSIEALQVQGDWKINIAKEPSGMWVVSVLFFNDTVGDDARKKVPPILLKGTATELDEGFFPEITKPVQETAQLFINMEQYLKEREQAKLQSQKEKDKATQEEKNKTDRQKKYEEVMKKASELEAAGKFREAFVKVPEADQYPEHADAIREKKSALAKQFSPDLFNDDTKTK